jgi:rhamnulokinase
MSGSARQPLVAERGPQDRRAFVAIDLGAESCRVSLLRWQAEVPQVHLVHRFANNADQRVDGLRWNLTRILEGLEAGLRQCAEIAIEGIRSIGVDGWAVDYVRLDDEGVPLGDPFCYRDPRNAAAEPVLHARLSAERMRELTGIQILPLNTVYQLFADTLADVFVDKLGDGAGHSHSRWLNLPEYILYWLGGRAVSERTNATHTQLAGVDGAWSAEIFKAIEHAVQDAPTIVEPGTDLGELRGPLTELPAFAGTRLVAPACHDTASAIAAIPDAGDDWAYISSGTWSLVGTVLDAPVNTAEARAENFTNLGGADGTVCFHNNVNGMWLLRQCMDVWAEEGVRFHLPQLIAEAAAIAPRGFTLEVDDPELLLQGDMPERINAQLRRRGLAELSPAAEHAPVMASFLFHSLAARYAEVLANVVKITGKKLKRLYIMGGGSQNELLNRLTAEATGLEVRRAGTECSTLGNFAVQLAALEPGSEPASRPTSLWAAKLAHAHFS